MNKILIVMLVILLGAGAGYYFGFDHGWEKSTEEVALNANMQPSPTPTATPTPSPTSPGTEVPFQKSANQVFYGTVTITGYLIIETRVCHPGDACGENVEYASFVFPDTDNQALKESP